MKCDIIVLCNRYNIRHNFNVFCSHSLSENDMCRLSLIYELLLVTFKLFDYAPNSEFMSTDEVSLFS
jgi:hypothetical protein